MNSKVKSIEIATEWWVDRITNPTREFFTSKKKNDSITTAGNIAFILAQEESKKLSKKQIEKFHKNLSEYIQEELQDNGICKLETKLYPTNTLNKAALSAGIEEDLFPWETTMTITNEQVEVLNVIGGWKRLHPIKVKDRVNTKKTTFLIIRNSKFLNFTNNQVINSSFAINKFFVTINKEVRKLNLEKDKYIIVEIIPTHSKAEKGTIAQISALKLEGLKLIDRFDYRLKDELIENEDLKNMIQYDKKSFTYIDNPYFIIEKFKDWIKDYPILILEDTYTWII